MSADACLRSKCDDITLPHSITSERLVKILAGTVEDHSGLLPGLKLEIEAEQNRYRKRIASILGKRAGYSEDPSSVKSFNERLELESDGPGDESGFNIVQRYKVRKEYFYIPWNDAVESYRRHCFGLGINPVDVKSFKLFMGELGWRHDHKRKMFGTNLNVFCRYDLWKTGGSSSENDDLDGPGEV